LGDPFIPSWGKIINDARTNGALFEGLYYWILEPAALLLVTSLAFALLGFAGSGAVLAWRRTHIERSPLRYYRTFACAYPASLILCFWCLQRIRM
jgi:hypothetical protein